MTQLTAITITGIDPGRPPRIRKEAYIDLYFVLSEDPPEDWCEDFNALGRRVNPMAKVDIKQRGFINTYANAMDAIPAHFAEIKQAVADCNTQYLEKIQQRASDLARDNAASGKAEGPQQQLNAIIESLDFET